MSESAMLEELAKATFREVQDAIAARDAEIARLKEALNAQIKAHAILCKAAGLDEQAHRDGTAQARAAINPKDLSPEPG